MRIQNGSKGEKYSFTVYVKPIKKTFHFLCMLFISYLFIFKLFTENYNECLCSRIGDKTSYMSHKNDKTNRKLKSNKDELESLIRDEAFITVDKGSSDDLSDCKEIEWSFYLIISNRIDLSKITIRNSPNNPIKAFKLSSKVIEIYSGDYINMKYPILIWENEDNFFQKVNFRLIVDSKIINGRIQLSYSDPNYQIKTFKLLLRNKYKHPQHFHVSKVDDFINVKSICNESIDTLYFFEITQNKKEEVNSFLKGNSFLQGNNMIQEQNGEDEESSFDIDNILSGMKTFSESENYSSYDNKDVQSLSILPSNKYYDDENIENIRNNQELKRIFESITEESNEHEIYKVDDKENSYSPTELKLNPFKTSEGKKLFSDILKISSPDDVRNKETVDTPNKADRGYNGNLRRRVN